MSMKLKRYRIVFVCLMSLGFVSSALPQPTKAKSEMFCHWVYDGFFWHWVCDS